MKKFLLFVIAVLAGLAAPLAHAWTYNNGDVLLLFRNVNNPNNDVEYDLGNVSQFLGQTNGYTTTVTNWDPTVVENVYGSDLTGVSVALLAVTSSTNAAPIAWVSGIEPNTTAYDDSVSDWNYNYYSKISSIGGKPQNTGLATASTNAYSINPYGLSKAASYEYIASGGTYNGVDELGGSVPFVIEQTIPGSLDFWAVQPLGSSVPDHIVGTFNITASGVLTFTAGPSPTTINGLTYSASVSGVNIATTVGVNYQLVGTTQLGKSASWATIGSLLTGDGNAHTLNETNTAISRFYRVTAQ